MVSVRYKDVPEGGVTMHKPATLMAAALLLATAPLHVDWSVPLPQLRLQDAAAKGGNNGNGKGNAGNSGNSGSKGNNGRAADRSSQSADAVVDKQVGKDSVRIRYRNGYREQIYKDRFIMKDAKGRTVINRHATPVDRVRLWLKQAVP